jgi:Co/Zn/Cd efflux system component
VYQLDIYIKQNRTKMKKVFAIVALATTMMACGGASTETTTDSTAVTADSTAVVADSTSAAPAADTTATK